MALLPGPTLAQVTLGTTASANAPALTYYHYFTYTATANESLISGPYIQNVNAGFVPNPTVLALGAPAAATNSAVYTSLLPTYEALQQATKTTTALGTPFAESYPLTNSISAAGAATNVAGALLGIANADSNATFFSGAGGAQSVGNTSLFGATQSFPPLDSLGALAIPTTKLQNCLFEFSLVQPFFPALNGTQVGLTLDATTGFYVVDTSQSNKVAVITELSQGPAPFYPTIGDVGARVKVSFIASALA